LYLAADHDLTAIGLVIARDDLDERGLARAILTQQGEDGAARRDEVDPVQDLDAAE
jgi:hypothetical protein